MQIVDSIPTRGNVIYNIFISSLWCLNASRFRGKMGGLKLYLLETEYLNTRFPGSLQLQYSVKLKKNIDYYKNINFVQGSFLRNFCISFNFFFKLYVIIFFLFLHLLSKLIQECICKYILIVYSFIVTRLCGLVPQYLILRANVIQYVRTNVIIYKSLKVDMTNLYYK